MISQPIPDNWPETPIAIQRFPTSLFYWQSACFELARQGRLTTEAPPALTLLVITCEFRERLILQEKTAEETESAEKKQRRIDAFKIMQDEIEMFLADLGLPSTFANRMLRPPDFADESPPKTNTLD